MLCNILEPIICTGEKVIELIYPMDVLEFLDYTKNGSTKTYHENGKQQ
jgi:hypothetical protein